jgi:hypothetical protein
MNRRSSLPVMLALKHSAYARLMLWARPIKLEVEFILVIDI